MTFKPGKYENITVVHEIENYKLIGVVGATSNHGDVVIGKGFYPINDTSCFISFYNKSSTDVTLSNMYVFALYTRKF